MYVRLGIGIVAAYLGYRWWFGSGGGGGAAMPTGPITLSAAQQANASIVLSMFAAAGYHANTAKAALVNAYAESRLDASARSPAPEDSVGLFQINSLGGRRSDPSRPDTIAGVDRANPAQNTAWILRAEKTALGKIDLLARGGASIADLSAAFAEFVERPADIRAAKIARAALALRLYPAGA